MVTSRIEGRDDEVSRVPEGQPASISAAIATSTAASAGGTRLRVLPRIGAVPILAAMTRHLRLLIVVCPTALLALCAPAIAQTPARSGLDDLQQVAAARGAEALDGVEAISRGLFPKFEPEGLALMVVQPGRWAVLLNHPAPPAGFAPAGEVERRKIVPEDPD